MSAVAQSTTALPAPRSLSSDAPSQDPDTDAYMADLAIDTVRLVPPYAAMHQSVPPAEKIARVRGCKGRAVEPRGHMVSNRQNWWKRWKKACTGVRKTNSEELYNSALVDGNGYPPGSTLVPEAAWNDLVSCNAHVHPIHLHIMAPRPWPTLTKPLHIEKHPLPYLEGQCPSVHWFRLRRIRRRRFSTYECENIEGTAKSLEETGLQQGDAFVVEFKTLGAWFPELVDYFLTGVFTTELNPDNPLGMHGAIAQAFGALLSRIWAASGSSTSYAPREFKTQLQRFAPQFSGYQQHDSQELVAFLLDGLHEDLNRVIKKPYVEKPDWEGGATRRSCSSRRRAGTGNMLRNDSVIVDLFQGQYQSTLVSITFDPFMYLTLPLPVQKKWKHNIFYVPWDVEKPHVKVPVEIGRDASFKDLRQLLGRWMGVPPDNLLTLETFSHKFYKNLDDSLLCGEMATNDVIVCYELPCHAQQSRTYKPQPGDPIIVPVYLADYRPPATARAHDTITHFGHPTIAVLSPEEAGDARGDLRQVVRRLERWANNAKYLYQWEVPGTSSAAVEAVQINGIAPADSLVEIKLKANGDVEHAVLEEPPEGEGDITDEKAVIVKDEDVAMDGGAGPAGADEGEPPELFHLRVQPNMKDYGTANARLEARAAEAEAGTHVGLMREGDLLMCEFDENMKAFYFGEAPMQRFSATTDDSTARWEQWGTFVHPEYEESQREAEQKKNRGISLQDCLDEFTKEEQLGEDDLWYCPRCKKHQQATKKFDLWKAPDVLVVHLKRFSNSRTLRDKIDAFVDFPVEGLDLGEMVGERAAARRLIEAGGHMGGLGGGHYRAYALNHSNQKWYHFDDSYVTPAKPEDAVNANAYLLFYRRRTTEPLGGKTKAIIEAARLKRESESSKPIADEGVAALDARDDDLDLPGLTTFASGSMRSAGGSSPSSISMHDEPPDLVDGLDDDPLVRAGQRFDFPDPSSNKAAEGDTDDAWRMPYSFDSAGSPTQWSPIRSPGTLDTLHSPSENSSSLSDNPFTDGHAETHYLKID
ncbi:hypothetical protein B0H14DRAFT_2856237 [Mycena olivaceomarginata]|nr:hypothetical protein B0H14DRAFT_2856237 [Mycena olivaceomarginata]